MKTKKEMETILEINGRVEHLPDWKNPASRLFSVPCEQFPYGMENRYLFRIIVQRKPRILKAIIRELLEIPEEHNIYAMIENPIIYGEYTPEVEKPLKVQVQVEEYWEGMIQFEMESMMCGVDVVIKITTGISAPEGLYLRQTVHFTADTSLLCEYYEETDSMMNLLMMHTRSQLLLLSEKNEVFLEFAETFLEMLEDKSIKECCLLSGTVQMRKVVDDIQKTMERLPE